MKSLVQKILASCAHAIIRKYQPDIVAVTGSVGKTTAKEAIVRVLSGTFSVRGNEKSYNNELGVPLTVIGCHAPGRSVWRWIGVFFHAMRSLSMKDRSYPAVLVLEMGADAPGDIEYLVSIAPPKVGVITAIGPTHLEKLGSLERLIEEKMKIFSRHTKADQWMILNADDPCLQQFFHSEQREEFRKAQMLTFGVSDAADLRISDISERYAFHPEQKEIISGVSCMLKYEGVSARCELPHCVGRHVLPSIIAAAAVGCMYHIPLAEIVRRLQDAEPAPGRMHLIAGIKHTLIIDDTYNSSPNAVRGAVDVLMSFEIDGDARRIAVLGDMRELGAHTEPEHRDVGAYVAERGVDYLFAVGSASSFFAAGAHDANLDSERIFVFNDSASAGRALQDFMKEGDVVLIKGSQNVLRMERIVKEIMAEPSRASELLVRQGKEWM